jgi:hypothetical protein
MFESYPQPSKLSITSEIDAELEAPEKWIKKLSGDEIKELLNIDDRINFTMNINHTKLTKIVNIIGDETGLRVTSYNLNVEPKISVEAEINGIQVFDNFTPKLKIQMIQGGDKGDHLSIENLDQTKGDTIQNEIKIPQEWVNRNQNILTLLLVVCILGTAASSYNYLITKPEQSPSKKIEKIINPHRELIIETKEEPPKKGRQVSLEKFDDLVKTAEILARPILQKGNVFYIIDENTTYTHLLDEKNL